MTKSTSFEEQKGTRYIRGNLYFGIIIFNCLLSTRPCLRFLLICFVREVKIFYQSSFRNEVDFMNVINNINIFLSLENPCTFLLAKEKTWKCGFNTNSELSQNRAEKKIMPFKTTVNWLFTDIWCYLAIALVVLTEKLSFLEKQLSGFIISLNQ